MLTLISEDSIIVLVTKLAVAVGKGEHISSVQTSVIVSVTYTADDILLVAVATTALSVVLGLPELSRMESEDAGVSYAGSDEYTLAIFEREPLTPLEALEE